MQYLTFNTEPSFNIWLAEMNTLKGYDDGKGTATYTSATEGTDGLWYAAIRTHDIPLLDTMVAKPNAVVSAAMMIANMPVIEEEII